MAIYYRNKETGEEVPESTYNRSVARGGTRYEAVDSLDEEPTQVFGSVDDLFNFNFDDYDGPWDTEFYEGGADYGEE